MFSFEGFSCRLDVLYGGLVISKLQILIKKETKFERYFFSVLVIKTLDPCPDPDSLEMPDMDPYPDSDPQHWSKISMKASNLNSLFYTGVGLP
jgi:hypothetical protein